MSDRPTVLGASPVCLDCNKAGIRNCSHFDNCDGVWVYKPDQPRAASGGALSAELAREICNRRGPETLAEQVERATTLLAAHDQAKLGTLSERIVSREEFNNSIADEAAQSCVDWSDPERRKEALRYIVKQIWNEAITESAAHDQKVREQVLEEAAQCVESHTALSSSWYKPEATEPYRPIAVKIRALASRAEEKEKKDV